MNFSRLTVFIILPTLCLSLLGLGLSIAFGQTLNAEQIVFSQTQRGLISVELVLFDVEKRLPLTLNADVIDYELAPYRDFIGLTYLDETATTPCKLFDLDTLRVVYEVGWACDYNWSPDGSHMLFGQHRSGQNTFTLLELTSRTVINQWQFNDQSAYYDVGWSPQGDYALIRQQDTIHILHVDDNRLDLLYERPATAPDGDITTQQFWSDDWLAVTLTYADLSTDVHFYRYRNSMEPTIISFDAAFHAGRWSNNRFVAQLEYITRSTIFTINPISGESTSISDDADLWWVVWSPDQRYAAMTSINGDNRSLVIYETETGIRTNLIHNAESAFSTEWIDSRLIYGEYTDGAIQFYVWHAGTADPIPPAPEHLLYSLDSGHILWVTCDENCELTAMQPASGEQTVHRLPNTVSDLERITMQMTDRMVLLSDQHQDRYIYDMVADTLTHYPNLPPANPFTLVEVSDDARYLVFHHTNLMLLDRMSGKVTELFDMSQKEAGAIWWLP